MDKENWQNEKQEQSLRLTVTEFVLFRIWDTFEKKKKKKTTKPFRENKLNKDCT